VRIILLFRLLRPKFQTALTLSILCQMIAQPLHVGGQSPAADLRKAGTAVRIELIGDSTQTDNAGYGRGFCANLTSAVDCINMAHGGASTKTFRADGYWSKALVTKPDYMLIQFGHNDMQSADHNARQTTMAEYEQNLRAFVEEARSAGIHPILVTPLTRRYFGDDGKIHSDLLAHAETMKRVAESMHVPLTDLQAESIAYLDEVGPTAGQALGITKKDSDGRTIPDKTHLNWQGSYVFGRIVAVDLGKAVPSLEPYVRKNAASLPAEGQLAMRVIRQETFKIVLVGDSTVAEEGGWGPGLCASVTGNVTCIDLAKNGRSSKSFIDEGLWAKALAERGQYYFIQFGHNDGKPKQALHTDPETTFSANLHRYISDVRQLGGIPILVTPLSRRNYEDGTLIQDDLSEYAAAMRKVAGKDDVTLVDLYGMSRHLLQGMNQEAADQFDAAGHPDASQENGVAKPDRTHLNEHGKQVFGRFVADNVIRTQVELGPNIVGVPDRSAVNVAQPPTPTDGH
jgi:lysophospholipase L1-like esterase